MLLLKRLWATLVALLLPALCLTLLLAGAPAGANDAPSAALNPEIEARMMAVAVELRCLVCQNQTIADSHSGLAEDLRQQIREMLAKGMTEDQINHYMTDRYGDFVLYRPPLKTTTVLLWLGPFTLLAIAVLMMVLNVRRRRRSAQPAALSEADTAKARELLANPPQN